MTEIEIKLIIDQAIISDFAVCPLISSANMLGTKNYENTYFDTGDLALNRQKMALRIRKVGKNLLQTVKCASASDNGLSIRPEWETTYDGAFDFSRVTDITVRDFLASIKADLVPVFQTDFVRTVWETKPSADTLIHIMLDVGAITAGNAVQPISEVELELVNGSIDDLTNFAAQLRQEIRLTPSDVSKAERGFNLWGSSSLNKTNANNLCPLCGQLNDCEVEKARDGGQCWCATVSFSESLLANVPPERSHKSCICKACVTCYGNEDTRGIS
jgi:inorganic triphosphatase YgiF